jgi:hypothetical protein
MTRRLALIAVLTLSAALALTVACDDEGEGGEGTPTATTPEATATSIAGEPTATGVPEVGCSAAPLPDTPVEQAGLPEAVAQMRRDIVAAAVACDYDRLQELALAGSPTFNYSFGEPFEGGTPGAYWEQLEDEGEDILATLVRVLDLDYREENGVYDWPFAAALNPLDLSAEERAALDSLLAQEPEIAAWDEGVGYIGYRAGITTDGDWTFFVAGD